MTSIFDYSKFYELPLKIDKRARKFIVDRSLKHEFMSDVYKQINFFVSAFKGDQFQVIDSTSKISRIKLPDDKMQNKAKAADKIFESIVKWGRTWYKPKEELRGERQFSLFSGLGKASFYLVDVFTSVIASYVISSKLSFIVPFVLDWRTRLTACFSSSGVKTSRLLFRPRISSWEKSVFSAIKTKQDLDFLEHWLTHWSKNELSCEPIYSENISPAFKELITYLRNNMDKLINNSFSNSEKDYILNSLTPPTISWDMPKCLYVMAITLMGLGRSDRLDNLCWNIITRRTKVIPDIKDKMISIWNSVATVTSEDFRFNVKIYQRKEKKSECFK